MAWSRPTLTDAARTAGAVLILAAAIAVGVYGLAKLAVVTLAIFGAVVLSCLLWPLARWLERRRVPRSLASFAALLVAIGVLGGALAWILPEAVREISANREQLTGNVRQLVSSLSAKLPEGADLQQFVDRAGAMLQKNSQRIVAGVASGVVTATEFVTGLLLGLVLAFFFLRDGRRLALRTFGYVSPHTREVFEPALHASWLTLRRWIRGAAIIAFIDALGIGVGLAILGVPLVLPLALLIFFGAFVPVVGALVTGAVAVLVTWATSGTTDALIALAIVIGVQQLEGNVLEPVIMGRAVPLHPAVVLVVIAVGAILAGVAGAFIAVPLAAVVTAFLREVYDRSDPPHPRGRRPRPDASLRRPRPEAELSAGH